jgi:glycosyltransferase involved in cell wall biosynthesis
MVAPKLKECWFEPSLDPNRLDKRDTLSPPRVEQPALSVIIPLYNEEESIQPLYAAVVRVLDALPLKSELVLVDDGSKDATFGRAEAIAHRDARVRVIKFRKNYGQTAAMAAGIDHARGEILVTMDGDLQNDPQDISRLIDKLEEGYHIAVGWRHKRQDKLISRKVPSRIANWLIGKITGVPIKDNGCSLKAYRAEVIKQVPLYSEMHRFIPAMASTTGARVAELKVNHRAREFGKSKYGLSRIYKVILDLIAIKTLISFAARPLRWFGAVAMASGALGLAALTAAIVNQMLAPDQPAFILLGISMLFATLAAFLVACGILADLIYRTGNLKLERLPLLTAEFGQSKLDQIRESKH